MSIFTPCFMTTTDLLGARRSCGQFISRVYLWGLCVTILCCMLKLGENVLKRCALTSPISLGRYGSQCAGVYLSLLTLLSFLALASVCWSGGSVRIWLLVDCCMGLGGIILPSSLLKGCKSTAQITHGGIIFADLIFFIFFCCSPLRD